MRTHAFVRWPIAAVVTPWLLVASLTVLPLTAAAQATDDPRVGLDAGWMDAEQAIRHLDLVAHRPRPEAFVNPADAGDFSVINTDMAFRGNLLFLGSYNGVQIWDITTATAPTLRATIVCPGGQGDVSVYENLLFMSVEETRARLDCGVQGVPGTVSAERFRGVRIFDISNLDRPRQVAAVQTCRGSHTHTLLTPADDPQNVYVYVSGTSDVRPAAELAGCSGLPAAEDPNTALFRIEVIQVPVARPQEARVVSMPRIFADTTGNPAGLWMGGQIAPGGQVTDQTNMCHDITVYPALDLAAGACSGNGILLDISDPVNPRRIDEVMDPNFAYWHSATFSNDGKTVLFTDEWGGGVAPRCRATDRVEWGADAIFTLNEDRELNFASYYKLPAPQTAEENCVAHNGSLIPVPGRDIMVQAWYQGGISVLDFTDPDNPVEIGYFDRGPLAANQLMLGGYWSAYWYNGHIFGSEIARGLDVFELEPSEYLTRNEIEAAKLVRFERFNPQDQARFTWPATFVVARAYVDGIAWNDALRQPWAQSVRQTLDRAERLRGQQRRTALTELAARLEREAGNTPAGDRVRALAEVVSELANAR